MKICPVNYVLIISVSVGSLIVVAIIVTIIIVIIRKCSNKENTTETDDVSPDTNTELRLRRNPVARDDYINYNEDYVDEYDGYDN